jgi:hypothetical protein
MTLTYRVVDLRQPDQHAETEISGVPSPEAAARQVLGMNVVRSGSKRDLVAKVYWQTLGQPLTMVRFYRLRGEP